MDAQPTSLIARMFQIVETADDPRAANARHFLTDILAIATLAVMCGSDDIRSIVEYAKDEHEWLKTFLPLPHGIPSISTFRRVLAALKPRALEDLIKRWSGELAGSLAGKQIAIDGKALRHSFDKASEQSHVHLVTAWSVEDKLVLAQQAVDQKGNEITALPEVLKMLDLKDATVTVDAMGTQTDIAEQIVKGGGNYVMAVKDNHPTLSDTITRNLDEMVLEKFKDVKHVYYESTDAGHGRIDQRKVWATSDIQWLARRGEWKNLKSVIVVESTRQEVLKNDLSKTKSSTMRRYYISSLPSESGEKLASLIRNHWSIENGQHWVLDVAFNEDQSRVRKDHGARNLAVLRRIALGLLRRDKSTTAGAKIKRQKASRNHDYLMKVLLSTENAK